ncbi:MAG: hypothetical protein EB072_08470, partial [Betaproteobacteria bacterium]|nr:hypothetical protein [Betaproteobacteria bacterium]
MAQKTWTRTEIETLINTNDRAVERAMVAIWERQTRDEQATETTRHHNGIGFSGWTAKSGTYFANWVRSGRSLSGKHLAKARKIALHHAGQLTRI